MYPNISIEDDLENCCEALSIPGIREALDRMMVVDYLIVNEDRQPQNSTVP